MLFVFQLNELDGVRKEPPRAGMSLAYDASDDDGNEPLERKADSLSFGGDVI
jgi:hypothetical protein